MALPEAVSSPRDGAGEGAPRVLQVMGSLDVGGAETMVLTAAEQLGERCRMDFLVFGEREGALEPRAEALGARVLRMPAPRDIGRTAFVRALRSMLRGEGYDAVHSHVNLASGAVLRAAAAARVPIRIAHSHTTESPASTMVRRIYGRLARRDIVRHATVLAACGQEAGEKLFGPAWSGGRGVMVPNGIVIDRFLHVRESRERMRTILGLGDARRVVGAISRLVAFKNHRFLIDVIDADRARGGDLQLVIVGDGPLRDDIEDDIAKRDLGDRIRLLGIRDDVGDILGMLDVLAMPSKYEGLPVVLIEAQAAGTPVVMSDTIARESDLGLGLMRRLPLDDVLAWMRELNTEVSAAEPTAVRERFAATGYDVRASAAVLRRLYVQDGRGDHE